MTRKLLVRQGGGTATEVDFLDLATPRKGAPWFDSDSPLIQMGQRFANGESAMGYFKIVDPAAALSTTGFRTRPWAEVRLTEDASGDELTLAWMRVTANDASRRAPGIGGDEVQHDPQLMDCNLDLRGIPFRNSWARPAETDQDRLNVLEGIKLDGAASSGTISRETTDITIAALASGHLADFSAPTDLDANTYPDGTEVTEVLADIAEQSGKQWGVVLHHDGGSTHKCLLYIDQDDLTTYTTAVRISDQNADWDPDDPTAPTFEPHWLMGAGREQNMEGVVSGMIGLYGGTNDIPRTVYVETGEAPEEWETWVDVYNDDQADNETQATRHTTWQLQDRRRPYQSIKVSILVSAEQAHLVEAGMAIETKSVVMEPGPNKHTWLWRRIAEKTIEPVPDGRYWLHLHLERPHHSHGPSGGAGQPASTTPKPAPEFEPDPGDTLLGFFNANDAGGDTLSWDGILANQGGVGSGLGALGTDFYYFKSSAPDNYSFTRSWTAGDQIRVEGYARGNNHGNFQLVFTNLANGTNGTSVTSGTIVGGPYVLAVPDGVAAWNFFSVGPFTAPVGTTSYAFQRTGSSIVFDEVSVYLVGDPTANDVDAVNYGDFPHASTHWLPSDYVEARLDDLQTQTAALPQAIRDSLSWKTPVRVATTANGTLATAYEAGDTIDGVTLAEGDRILLKDQTTGADRGIYTVNASGAPTRATGMDEDSEVSGAVVLVLEGTANADTIYVCTTDEPITLGTTSLTFTALSSGGGSYTDEQAQDAVGTILVDTSTVDLTYTDATPSITAAVIPAGIKLDDLGTPDDNTDLNASSSAHGLLKKLPADATKYLDGSGNFTDPGLAGGSTGNVIATPSGSVITIPGLALGDRKPASAGTYDQEFDGTADTLPTDYSWASTPAEWHLNSRWPSLLTVEGTANTNYTLDRANFNPTGAWGIWAKMYVGSLQGADNNSIRFYVAASTAGVNGEQRGMQFRATASHGSGVRGLKIIANTETVWWSELGPGRLGEYYMGMTNDGSNGWTAWISSNGVAWDRQDNAAQSHVFTPTRWRILISVGSFPSFVAIDWIRYRADNAFPHP